MITMKSKPKLFVRQVTKLLNLDKSDERSDNSHTEKDSIQQSHSNRNSINQRPSAKDNKVPMKRKSVATLNGPSWRRTRENDLKSKNQRKINAEHVKGSSLVGTNLRFTFSVGSMAFLVSFFKVH